MIVKKDFLKKYNITEASLEKTGIEWKQLEGIYAAHEKAVSTLEPYLTFFAECLRRAPRVHSIKARLKDPEHVIEKIIREKQSAPSLEITTDNYDTIITDLIGLRALHLFKEDWESIHDWIKKSWELKAKPVVNIREGDQPELVSLFKKKGCEVKKHPFGYRSAHYIVVSKLSRKEIVAEIQVRTIFEEGWSEIDHLIRYPYVKDNPILEQYLVMFNRLAGSADEMGSYIRYLDAALKMRELDFCKAIEEKTKKNEELQEKIGKLEARIEKMKIEQEDRESLKLGLAQISDITTSMPDFSKFAAPDIDFSKLSVPDPDIDFSKFAAPDIDFSKLSVPDPDIDFSKFAAPKIDFHDTGSSAMDLLNDVEDLKGTTDQKSSSSDEENKTDDDQHKKKGQERKEGE